MKSKKLIWERDGVKREAICSNDENDWENFKAIKNLVNYRIPDNKKQYYNSLFLNNVARTKETWSSINSLLNKTKSSTNFQKIVQDGIKITDPVAISNIFNKHFTEIGHKLAAETSTTDAAPLNIQQCSDVFELHEVISPFHVYELIQKLPMSKACDLDNIPVRLLKLINSTANASLTHIINLAILREACLLTGSVPEYRQFITMLLN